LKEKAEKFVGHTQTFLFLEIDALAIFALKKVERKRNKKSNFSNKCALRGAGTTHNNKQTHNVKLHANPCNHTTGASVRACSLIFSMVKRSTY
jgi:hypothetical protein